MKELEFHKSKTDIELHQLEAMAKIEADYLVLMRQRVEVGGFFLHFFGLLALYDHFLLAVGHR